MLAHRGRKGGVCHRAHPSSHPGLTGCAVCSVGGLVDDVSITASVGREIQHVRTFVRAMQPRNIHAVYLFHAFDWSRLHAGRAVTRVAFCRLQALVLIDVDVIQTAALAPPSCRRCGAEEKRCGGGVGRGRVRGGAVGREGVGVGGDGGVDVEMVCAARVLIRRRGDWQRGGSGDITTSSPAVGGSCSSAATSAHNAKRRHLASGTKIGNLRPSRARDQKSAVMDIGPVQWPRHGQSDIYEDSCYFLRLPGCPLDYLGLVPGLESARSPPRAPPPATTLPPTRLESARHKASSAKRSPVISHLTLTCFAKWTQQRRSRAEVSTNHYLCCTAMAAVVGSRRIGVLQVARSQTPTG